MITIWRMPIVATVEQVLKDIKLQLYGTGLLREIRDTLSQWCNTLVANTALDTRYHVSYIGNETSLPSIYQHKHNSPTQSPNPTATESIASVSVVPRERKTGGMYSLSTLSTPKAKEKGSVLYTKAKAKLIYNNRGNK